jgi:hypothetical protein
MDLLTLPEPVRDKLGDGGSDGLLMMFDDAHRFAVESFERRLAEETTKLRFQWTTDLANLEFDLLKWSFLFWIGQVAVIISVLSWMLRGIR